MNQLKIKIAVIYEQYNNSSANKGGLGGFFMEKFNITNKVYTVD